MEVGLRYGAETDQIINQMILNFSELSPRFYKVFSSIAQIQGIAVCTSLDCICCQAQHLKV